MPKLKKLNVKEIKKLFKKLPLLLAQKAFLAFLVLFLFCVSINALIFYHFYNMIEKAEPQITKQFKFKSETYENILSLWQTQEERLNETNIKQYPVFFTPPPATE
jgi:hypothetical protein